MGTVTGCEVALSVRHLLSEPGGRWVGRGTGLRLPHPALGAGDTALRGPEAVCVSASSRHWALTPSGPAPVATTPVLFPFRLLTPRPAAPVQKALRPPPCDDGAGALGGEAPAQGH